MTDPSPQKEETTSLKTEYYRLTLEELFAHFKTSVSGFSTTAAGKQQQVYGRNELPPARKRSRLTLLLAQFSDVMIILLIVAAGVSFWVGEHTDAIVILIIIIGNAWLGFSQEYDAEESIRMLQKMTPQFALVIRDGHPQKIEAVKLVPGDLILLSAGDIVSADARLIELSSFRTDESSLTGESVPVEKQIADLEGAGLSADAQYNMVFKGTLVTSGAAKAIVTGTGSRTELGKIAGLLDIKPQQTPLQKKLALFSKQLAIVVVLICIVVFVVGLMRGAPAFEMFLTALSLAVAALPEALPAVITIALAIGAKNLVKQHALIRKLPAVETLGSVTYICSDKTGTLTQNVMTVERFVPQNEKEELLSNAMMLNNEVRFSAENTLLGDPTETALVSYVQKKGFSKHDADLLFPLINQLPFDSERMRMGTLHRYKDQWILFVKGAPVKMIEVLSPVYNEQIPGWIEQNREWAQEGLRVLFFAYKIFDHLPEPVDVKLEKELDFLGMVAMIDPPRPEVIEAVRECHRAGMKTVMITGDQPLTALAIAGRLGMMVKGAEKVVTGTELQSLTDEELQDTIQHTSVYARIAPEQKLRIVKALQHNGQFVAMTGDGVNDSPSLKQADIGIAMGITGTDVSKQAADMILLDDNYATIVKAIREGRRIYDNVRNFIVYVLSCNLAEILVVFCTPFLGFDMPLLPIHILWINLVTDGLPGLALVAEPAEKGIMDRPPRPTAENFFSRPLIIKLVIAGMIMTLAAIFIQYWGIRQGYSVRVQQTMVFTALCFMQLSNALSVRSSGHFMASSKVFANKGLWAVICITVVLQLLIVYVPFLQVLLKTSALSWEAMRTIAIVTVLFFLSAESLKFFK